MTVVLSGSYDLSNTADLQRELLVIAGAHEVRIDLSGVEFLDCQALGVLLTSTRDAQRAGATVVIQGARPIVRRMLEVSGVPEAIRVEAVA